jgi:hypothetical protein
VIISVLHEEGETDDVLHDVFIQLWNGADRFVAEKGLHGKMYCPRHSQNPVTIGSQKTVEPFGADPG